MTKSKNHQNFSQAIDHYLNPQHLLIGTIIRRSRAKRDGKKITEALLGAGLSCYDVFYYNRVKATGIATIGCILMAIF